MKVEWHYIKDGEMPENYDNVWVAVMLPNDGKTLDQAYYCDSNGSWYDPEDDDYSCMWGNKIYAWAKIDEPELPDFKE